MNTRTARSRRKAKEAARRNAIKAQSDFQVVVLATMSAGKSSLINALIGHELLPTANEATTACVTSVSHRAITAQKFRAVCHARDGREIDSHAEAGIEQVRSWNADTRIHRIQLTGRFRTNARLKRGLVLHDTPGPNNSQDGQHATVTRAVLRNLEYDVLCYVLNAGQLGTHDDRALLEQVCKSVIRRSTCRVIFVLNKVDLLDEEQGESLRSLVENARHYLEGIGFIDPIIVPTIASTALSARKALASEPLTRAERLRLQQQIEDLDPLNNPLLQAAHMPPLLRRRVMRQLEKASQDWARSFDDTVTPDHIETSSNLQHLISHSGISTLEYFLNQRSSQRP